MEKTSKPVITGVFNIISGVFGLIGAASLLFGFSVVSGGLGIPGTEEIPGFVPGLILVMAIPSLLIALLALLGGIFAVQRQKWGLALAGSIAAILTFLPLGIPAIILVVQSKDEFK